MRAALERITSHRHFPLLAATLIGAVLIFSKLGGRGIANYDDCFYAQKAKELLSTGSWMTLYHAGQPSFENPPGFIWLQAFSYILFGVGDFSAIFPSALFGVLTIVLVYFFSRELSGPGAAGPAAFVMATTFFFIKYARHAMIDVTLTFFVTLALHAAVLALRRDRRWFLLWGAAAGFCILMKSVLGFFPPLITVVFLLATGRRRMLINPWFLAGSALVFAVGCSWYVHEYLAFGDHFTRLHFSWLILQRGFEVRTDPWYSHLSYLVEIATTYWPWLPFLAWGAWRLAGPARRGDEAAVLLLTWPLLTIAVMSLMQTRSSWYVMPAYAAAAMVCGRVIDGLVSDRFRMSAARYTAAAAIVAALAINLSPLELSAERERDVRTLAPIVRERALSGAKIIGYDFDFHSVNNALLFYSDQAARPVYRDGKELSAAMGASSPVVCVLYTRQLQDVLAVTPGAAVLAASGALTLVSNGR
jgi:4-amino-4-deoxy-L-arabinose transferase-like glycosyltransferase